MMPFPTSSSPQPNPHLATPPLPTGEVGTRLLVHAQRALLPGYPDLVAGWVETAAGRITAVGAGDAPHTPDIEWDGVLSPGFVDIHSHGGGGAN
ncbi:MAG: hypothetical protein LBC29_02100, partial [Propionibacteriaceae bacterium]|nr:hypothetical protein [Propionibacteriaceae bacterium]